MNYFKTIIFLICIMIFNYILGSAVLIFWKVEKRNFTKKIVSGFISTFLLGFCIGLPSQILAISWNLFFIIFCILLVLVLIVSTIYIKNELKETFKKFLENPILLIKKHLLQYWFIYLLVILFSTLSILNTQPYLWCNYHDDYYIVKVVNLKGAPHLLDEQYLLGTKIARTSFFSYISVQGYRFINTYELIYSVLGSMFGIDLAFFCRFSICIYIYFIVFMTYKLLAEKFIKNKYLSQYALLMFSLLLIPAGYASSLKFSIRMFENWRFQTAIYYGGSIVRVLGLPFYILAFSNIINKTNFKSIFSFLCIFILLLSFQTSALTYLLFIAPILIFLLILKWVNIKFKKAKRFKVMVIIITTFLLLILLSDHIVVYLPIDVSRANDLIQNYMPYYNDIFICDIFALFGFIPLGMCLYLHRKEKSMIAIDLLALSSYLIFRFNKSNYYLAAISQYRFYSNLRIMTSVLLLVVIYTGIFIVGFMEQIKYKKTKIFIPIISFSLVTCSFANIYINEKKIVKYTKAAQSATPLGYSFKILTNNDKMLPNMIVNIGNYFNKKPYGNYRLLTEGHIPYKNTYIDNISFLLASNRIELFLSGTDAEQVNPDYRLVSQFMQGEVNFSEVQQTIKNSNIKYIYTTREKCKNELIAYNYKVVYHDKQNHAWLFELI